MGGNEHPEKMTIRFNKLRKQKAGLYFWGYFLCEILNIVCLVVCFAILNNLFDGQFFNYGSNVVNFDKGKKTPSTQCVTSSLRRLAAVLQLALTVTRISSTFSASSPTTCSTN